MKIIFEIISSRTLKTKYFFMRFSNNLKRIHLYWPWGHGKYIFNNNDNMKRFRSCIIYSEHGGYLC